MTRTPKVQLALMLAVVCATGLLAQDEQKTRKEKREEAALRSVEGLVTTADASPAVGAVVQLKDTRTLEIRSFITQDGGKYHFSGLRPDIDYQLKADYNGMTSGWRTLSVFDSRKDALINLKVERVEKK
jgi:Carboxypeptidase regulatory-like domain